MFTSAMADTHIDGAAFLRESGKGGVAYSHFSLYFRRMLNMHSRVSIKRIVKDVNNDGMRVLNVLVPKGYALTCTGSDGTQFVRDITTDANEVRVSCPSEEVMVHLDQSKVILKEAITNGSAKATV